MKNQILSVVVVGTKSYLKPLKVCLSRIQAGLEDPGVVKRGLTIQLIVVTDKASEAEVTSFIPRRSFSEVKVIGLDLEEKGEFYGKDRQILIARLQSAGFSEARNRGCDYLWSVEADVLVPPNSLTCSLDMLDFDNGYYSVAFCTYVSHGGGSFLGGRGTPQNPICEDFSLTERQVHPKYLNAIKCLRKQLPKERKGELIKKMARKLHKLEKHARRRYPPKGNIFQVTATHGWRRRGWLNQAYPAIGKGSVVPTDWTGLGCTLMSKAAAGLANFEGYDGGGTQDLFLNWKQWYPKGMKFACITHCPCDHVVRKKDSPNGFAIYNAFHETSGETVGHLRYHENEFHEFL